MPKNGISTPPTQSPAPFKYPITDPAEQYRLLYEVYNWSADGAEFLVTKVQEEPENDFCRYLRRKFFQQPLKRKVAPPATPKVQIPDSLRWQVWERDNFTCLHCGTRKYLSADHIVPESKGGPTTIENLQTLCRSCNSRKGAKI